MELPLKIQVLIDVSSSNSAGAIEYTVFSTKRSQMLLYTIYTHFFKNLQDTSYD